MIASSLTPIAHIRGGAVFVHNPNESEGEYSHLASVIPGTHILDIHVPFEDPLIKEYTIIVLNMAVALFATRVVWITLFYLTTTRANIIQFWVTFCISIWVSLAMLLAAYNGATKRNPECFCGIGYLDCYYSWCVFGALSSVVYIITTLDSKNILSAIFNAFFIVFYVISGGNCRILLIILSRSKEELEEDGLTQTATYHEVRNKNAVEIPTRIGGSKQSNLILFHDAVARSTELNLRGDQAV